MAHPPLSTPPYHTRHTSPPQSPSPTSPQPSFPRNIPLSPIGRPSNISSQAQSSSSSCFNFSQLFTWFGFQLTTADPIEPRDPVPRGLLCIPCCRTIIGPHPRTCRLQYIYCALETALIRHCSRYPYCRCICSIPYSCCKKRP